MEKKTRVTYAKKNVLYGMVTYVLLMVLTFVSRKVLIDQLGDTVSGLQGLFQNILSFLNLVESGVGMAIMFSLYKPIAEGDRPQIKSLLCLYSKIYKLCGTIVLISGIVLLPFLNIFIKNTVDIKYAQICFMLYIIDTVIMYYFSYKISLLNASQNLYIVSFWDFVFKVIKTLLQIFVLFKYRSFAIFIVIQILTTTSYLITINYIVNKKFAWLKTERTEEVKDKRVIIRNIKALFIHKIGAFVVFSTDNLLITYFLGLEKVTLFGNYSMIISFCQNFVSKIFEGLTASIGNLLIEEDSKKSFNVFKKIFFFNFWISSFVAISLYNCIDSFIVIWLSHKYILDKYVVIILLINFYITTMRMSIDRFKDSAGLYYEDRYAPIFEVIINLVFSIILVKKLGLVGVFLGTFISNICVIFWIKPKIVFNRVFNKSFFEYLKYYLQYLCCAIVPFVLTRLLLNFITFNNEIINFLLRCVFSVIIINITYVIMFYRKEEFKYYKNLILKKFIR